MSSRNALTDAVWHLQQGHIIAYPTEAVYGFGCDPFNEQAVLRLLQLKQRPIEKGLIVLVENWQQVMALSPALTPTLLAKLKQHWPGAVTWLLPAAENVPVWVKGQHKSIAVRMTAHPLARQLCQAWGKPLISTSANIATQAPARSQAEVVAIFNDDVDFILTGSLGNLTQPTPIYDIMTGQTIRT